MLKKRILVLMFLLVFLSLVGCFPSWNEAPIITSTPGDTAIVGAEYTYTITATDPEGDSIIYSLVSRPTGMDFDGIATISWTPTEGQVGAHNVTVEASDGKKDTIQGFMITVSKLPPVNRAPVITPIPSLTAIAGVVFTYDVNATDPDGDTLDYSLATYTSMIINSTTGVISWIPTVVGSFPVILEVSDGELSVTQEFTITVIAGDLDKFEFNPIGNSKTSGDPFAITITAKDAHDNIATGYTGTGSLSVSAGEINPDPTITGSFLAGILTNQMVTIITVEDLTEITITINDVDDPTKTGTSVGFNVTGSGA